MQNTPETQPQETMAIIYDSDNILKEKGIPDDRREVLKTMLEAALDANVLESIEENIRVQKEVYKEAVTKEDLGKIARGYLFEAIALNNLPTEKSPYPEFELFLLEALKNPTLWLAEFDFEVGGKANRGFETEEEEALFEKYIKTRPTEEELKALRNNDAIIIHINENTGTAEITGVVEAKNHALHTGTNDEAQAKKALKVLSTTVNRYKEVFPLLVKYAGLEDIMPSKIDILEESKLTYTIAQPEDVRTENEKNPPKGAFAKAEFIYIPVKQHEIALMAEALMPHINLTPENKI